MGTRHLVIVKANGEYRVAQYGQWDGYPSGQGRTILSFLSGLKPEGWKKLYDKVLKVQETNEEWLKQECVACGGSADGSFDGDSYAKFIKLHPELSRDTGGDILEVISNADDGIRLNLGLDFIGDSLFCEWAYVIDFDIGTFEVFQGFNHTPLKCGDRFAFYFMGTDKEHPSKKVYYPCSLKALWYLDALPSVENFIAECNKDRDEITDFVPYKAEDKTFVLENLFK